MTIFRPADVSCIVTVRLSPEFMKRSADGLGVNVLTVALTGLGGEFGCGTPLLVMKAKLAYSRVVRAAQVGFNTAPVTGFSARLKMAIAAHHLVGSQLMP